MSECIGEDIIDWSWGCAAADVDVFKAGKLPKSNLFLGDGAVWTGAAAAVGEDVRDAICTNASAIAESIAIGVNAFAWDDDG